MRGSDASSPRLAATFDTGSHIKALVVNGNGYQLTTGHLQDLQRQPVPRLLHPYCVALVQQAEGCYCQGLLGTTNDHDLAGFAIHSSYRPQILGDRLPEDFCPLRITEVKGTDADMTGMSYHKVGPDLERK